MALDLTGDEVIAYVGLVDNHVLGSLETFSLDRDVTTAPTRCKLAVMHLPYFEDCTHPRTITPISPFPQTLYSSSYSLVVLPRASRLSFS